MSRHHLTNLLSACDLHGVAGANAPDPPGIARLERTERASGSNDTLAYGGDKFKGSICGSRRNVSRVGTRAGAAHRAILILVGLVGLATVGGMTSLVATWMKSRHLETDEMLRLASSQYVAGNAQVAAELAEQVRLSGGVPLGPLPSLPDEGLGQLGEESLGGETWAAPWEDLPPENDVLPPESSRPQGEYGLADRGDLTPDEPTSRELQERAWLALQQFLIGAGRHARAMSQTTPRERRYALLDAVRFLEKAQELGFPDGRVAAGHRLLGTAYHEIGRHRDAVDHLTRAMDSDLTLRGELLPLLARSQSEAALISPADALATLQEYLGDSTLDLRKRAESELLRIDLLNRLERFDEADALIDQVGQSIGEEAEQQELWALTVRDTLVLRSAQRSLGSVLSKLRVPPGTRRIAEIPRLWNAVDAAVRPETGDSDREEEASEPPAEQTAREIVMDRLQISTELYQRLLTSLEQLTELQRETPPKTAAQARLLAARIYLLLGRDDEALAYLTQVRQQRPFSEESLQGGLAEAELLADKGRGEELVQAAGYLVREIFQSRVLKLSQQDRRAMVTRWIACLQRMRAVQQYEAAITVANLLAPILSRPVAFVQEALGYRDWGDATLAAERSSGIEVSAEASAKAREHFRLAGDAFAEAAELRFTTEEYLPTLWNAIDSYQRGRQYTKSIELLEPYLRYEERGRRPRGLVAHGRALLADGKPDEAIESLDTCIAEYPRDPQRYDARLLAAQAARELGQLQDAERWLRDNLNDGQLTPQSPAWRDALYQLGEMLFEHSQTQITAALELPPEEKRLKLREIMPELSQATRRLNESVQRYWPSQEAQAAAYLLARAELLAANLPEAELEDEELPEPAGREMRQKIYGHRQSALDRYLTLIRFLDERQRDVDLSDRQQALLRNSLLGYADVLRQMDRNAEAAEAYREMAMRYMNEPPALEALLGQSRMLNRLGRRREADLLIRQATVVLDRIDEEWDDRFATITRYDREGWRDYLQWMLSRQAPKDSVTDASAAGAGPP